MNGGPFRSSQPAERSAASRPEQARRQPEEVRAAYVDQNAAYAAAPQQRQAAQKSSKKRIFIPIISILLVIMLAVGGWFAWSRTQTTNTAIDEEKYQAVFFTNGQVYFGKLKPFSGEYMQLTDIYYLQTQISGETDSENPQQTSSDQNDVQLIKLGDEIHGPEDMMMVSKQQVLFFENLKPDSKVAQSIEKYKIAN